MKLEQEVINGVKTIWHTGKENALQNMADLLLKMLFENELKKNKEVNNE